MATVYELPQRATVTSAEAPSTDKVEVHRVGTALAPIIDAIARHDEVWPHITNDTCPAKEDFTFAPLMEDVAHHFLGIYLNGEVVGFWALLWRAPDVLEMHTCVLPQGRGRVMAQAMPQMLKYVFLSTPAMALTAQRPTGNEAAAGFGKKLGMRVVGVGPGEWVKDGQASDLVYEVLPFMEWFMRLAGDARTRARVVISQLAIVGHFPKAAYLHSLFTSTLGDFTCQQS